MSQTRTQYMFHHRAISAQPPRLEISGRERSRAGLKGRLPLTVLIARWFSSRMAADRSHAAPGEADATDADAVAQSLAVAEYQVEPPLTSANHVVPGRWLVG